MSQTGRAISLKKLEEQLNKMKEKEKIKKLPDGSHYTYLVNRFAYIHYRNLSFQTNKSYDKRDQMPL